MKIEKAKKTSNPSSLSVTGRQSSVLRRSGSLQRMKRGRHRQQDVEQEDCEETYAQHGQYDDADEHKGKLVSEKFESNPSGYFEEKLLSGLFDSVMVSVVEELRPAVTSYQEMSGDKLDPAWDQKVKDMRARNPFLHRDSLEEDSIFSLGKIIASPRYGQYPDLSDDDDDEHVYLSLPPDPLIALPNLNRHVPMSAPAVRANQPQPHAQPPMTSRTKRSSSFKTDNFLLSRNDSERRKSDMKKQNRSLERNSKPGSSTSICSTAK